MKLQLKTVLIPGLLIVASCGGENPENTADQAARFSLTGSGNETCILDSRSGLVWAGKSDVAGLHDYRNTYTWYEPNEAHGELDYRGTEDGGECAGSACDTWHYVQAVNAAGYCGFHDWRMPGRDELLSISDLGRLDNPPTIDTRFFPRSQAAEYWSGNDYSFQWNAAWAWNFRFGHDRVDWKRAPKFVRLVRGSGENLPEVKE